MNKEVKIITKKNKNKFEKAIKDFINPNFYYFKRNIYNFEYSTSKNIFGTTYSVLIIYEDVSSNK